MRELPELGHFKPVQGNLDLSSIQIWPSGAIELVALLFKVCFRVEQMTGGFKDYITPDVTPGHSRASLELSSRGEPGTEEGVHSGIIRTNAFRTGHRSQNSEEVDFTACSLSGNS
jgi:hypothetical protein